MKRKRVILLLGIAGAAFLWMWYQREKARREAAIKAAQAIRTQPVGLI